MTGPLTIGSLFAGIGGFDLAGEAMGWRTSWFVEWDAACRGWLAEHFPDRPIYGDIHHVNFTEVARVDILCGGFPCPPVSAAGKRLGKLDDRWLWPEFARAIRDVRPRYVAIENVRGLLSTRDAELEGQPLMGTVLGDLATLGYDAEWEVLSAGDVGSPQERERVWIVAYTDGHLGSTDGREPDSWADGRHDTEGRRARVDDAAGRRLHPGSLARPCGEADRERQRRGDAGDGHARVGDANGQPAGRDSGTLPRAEGGSEGTRCGARRLAHGPWDAGVPVRGADGTVRLIPREAAEAGPESPLWPVADGLPGRVARLRAIGNAVVPQCVLEGPFRVIAEMEAQPNQPGAA